MNEIQPENERQNQSQQAPGTYRVVPANHGSQWLNAALSIVRQRPSAWIGIAAFLIFMMMIPYVNYIVAVLTPLAIGGIMIGCRSAQKGDAFKFDHLFAGFKQDSKELITLCGYYLVGSIMVNLSTYLILLLVGIDYQDVLAKLAPPQQQMLTEQQVIEWTTKLMQDNTIIHALLGILISLLLLIPVFMAIWFAPALIVFQKMRAHHALITSFKACNDNFKPFLVFGLVGLGYLLVGYFFIMILLVILPILGLPLFIFSFLLVFAISLATIYPAYQSLFEFNEDKQTANSPVNDSDSSMLA